MIYSTSARVRGPVEEAQRRARASAAASAGAACCWRRPGATIGRSRDCDIVLDDTGISRRHAEIRPAGGGWEIEDLGSTNGVLVNGAQIGGPEPLHPGDVIELGSTEVLFELA